MYCKNCGSEINNDQKFCPSCGTELQGIKKWNYPKPSNKKILFVFILIFIIILGTVSGGIGYYYKYKDVVMTVDGYDVSEGLYNCYFKGIYDEYNMYKDYGFYDDVTEESIHERTEEYIREVIALRNLFVEEGLSITSQTQIDYINKNVTSNQGEYPYTKEDCRERLEIDVSAANYYAKIIEKISDSEIQEMATRKESSKDYYNVNVVSYSVTANSQEEALSYLNDVNTVSDFIKSEINYHKDNNFSFYKEYSEDELYKMFEPSKTRIRDLASVDVKNWIISADVNATYVEDCGDNTYNLYMKCSDLYMDDTDNNSSYILICNFSDSKFAYSDSLTDYSIQAESGLMSTDFSNGEIFLEEFNDYVLNHCSKYGDQALFMFAGDTQYSNVFFIRLIEHSYYLYAFEDVLSEKINSISNQVKVTKRFAYNKTVDLSFIDINFSLKTF